MNSAAITTTKDTTLDADTEALQSALSDLLRIYQFRDRNQICCYDISVTQCYALEALVEHGPLRLGALAGRLYLDNSTTSRVVKALVRKGYAENEPESGDKRAVAIAVTRFGRRLLDKVSADLVNQQKEIVRDIDPKVRAGVVDVIRRLARSAEARFVCGVSVGTASCRPTGRQE